MTLSQQHRTTVHQHLIPMFGEDEAEAFMAEFPATENDQLVTKQFLRAELAERLPPLGWADFAAKADIASVRADMRSTEERLEERLGHRIDTVAADLRSLESRMDLQFERFGETVRADINAAIYKSGFGTFAALGILMTAISIFG